MLVGIAADHGAFSLKNNIKSLLEAQGYQVTDFGAHELDPADDYPDFVVPLAQAVAEGKVERGIALCGSGVGACFAVNKVKGIRGSLISDAYSAHQGVEHDDMNIICIGGRVTGEMLAWEIVKTFLQATYTGEERHARRLNKVKKLEE